MPREPFHLGTITSRFLRDEEIGSVFSEDRGKPVEHAARTAHDLMRRIERRVGFAEPGGETDPARHRVELGRGESDSRENEIRSDHPWCFGQGGVGESRLEERGWFALIEIASDPIGQRAAPAATVEEVAGLLEAMKDRTELLELAHLGLREDKGLGGNPPFLLSEETALRHRGADAFGLAGWIRHGGRCGNRGNRGYHPCKRRRAARNISSGFDKWSGSFSIAFCASTCL